MLIFITRGDYQYSSLAALTSSLILKITQQLQHSRKTRRLNAQEKTKFYVCVWVSECGFLLSRAQIVDITFEAKPADKYCQYFNMGLALTGVSKSDAFVCYTSFKNRINMTCELFYMQLEGT